MKPNFEESQFAALFQESLARRSLLPRNRVMVVPVGQVLEARLGFDMAWWLPRRHHLWRVLGIPGLPGLPRSIWGPSLPGGVPITGRAVNVFFQFKRSDYLYGANASYRRRFNEPYWRFRIDRSVNPGAQPQHDLLEALETRLGNKALVRYVAPRFHEFRDLERLAGRRKVAEHCVYVSPREFSPAHMSYHYSGTDQFVNPDPESREPSTWLSFMQSLTTGMTGADALPNVFDGLPNLFSDFVLGREEDLAYPWLLPQGLPDTAQELLIPLLPISRFLFENRIEWFIGLSPAD